MINSFVALDLETTGISPVYDHIIEIGAAKIVDGVLEDSIRTFINPGVGIDPRITELTGIDDDMVKGAPCIEEVIADLVDFIGELPLLGHNILFDYSFISQAAKANGLVFEARGIDTLRIARVFLPQLESKKLTSLCTYFQIDPGNSHRAYDDAMSAMQLYACLCELRPNDELVDSVCDLQFKVKKQSPITAAQERYLSALVTAHHITLSKEVKDMTKSEASREIDRILSIFGRI